MTGHISKNIMADSLTGMIFAAEGISGVIVLLNGPTGCRFYHSTTSQFLCLRSAVHRIAADGSREPVVLNYMNDWFFRQSRVPCTHLDGYDYVYGTAEKVREGLRYMKESIPFDLLVIVNSPGASLIGDNLRELAGEILQEKPCVVLESPGFSESYAEGYSHAALEILQQLPLSRIKQEAGSDSRLRIGQETTSDAEKRIKQEEAPDTRQSIGQEAAPGAVKRSEQEAALDAEKRIDQEIALDAEKKIEQGEAPDAEKKNEQETASDTGLRTGQKAQEKGKSVNILGLSIWNRYYEGDRSELIRLLKLCGIEVNCVLCGGCSLEELLRLPEADLNLVIDPQLGKETARYLEQEYGMASIICPALPIGFDATEQLLSAVCEQLGAEEKVWRTECEQARARAWYKINDIYEMCGMPKGVPFAVEGSASQVCAYTEFFAGYLGMLPECLSVCGEADLELTGKLEKLADRYGAGAALRRDILDTRAELVFGDANTIAALKTTDRVFCGIEISLPGMGYVDVTLKTHLGIQGALFLTEQVLNGLMSRL